VGGCEWLGIEEFEGGILMGTW